MNETDKAYVAGLIDGEGSICLSRNHKKSHRSPSVTFPNTSPELICIFNSLCGGVVCNKRKSADHHTSSQHVKLTYNAALDLLAQIRPYMHHPKKCYRADLLLSEYKAVTPRNGKYTDELLVRRADFEHRFFHPSTS
jgi:hypothetical protein